MNVQSEGADYDRRTDICGDHYNLGYFQKLDHCPPENRKANKKALNKIGRDIKTAGK